MITVMGIKARTMGFDLDDIKIEVLKIMKGRSAPGWWDRINISYTRFFKKH
ncbi:MAG: hypothetical protein WDO16_07560 [Bacteroidota bacterium]